MKILGTKAYWVDLGEDEGQVIRFAQNEKDIESRYDAVSIKRAPQYDCHWQLGYVPPMVLVDAGWSFECDRCYKEIHEEHWDYEADEAIHPVAKGLLLFCSDACLCEHNAESSIRKIRVAQAKAFLLSRYPKAQNLRVHCWGGIVTASFGWANKKRRVDWDSKAPELLSFGWQSPEEFAKTEKEFRTWAAS